MKRELTLKYVKVGLGAVLLVVFLYLLASTGRVAKGISRAADMPTLQVRLQIINGSSEGGITHWVAGQVSKYADNDLNTVVVDVADFNLRRVARSFIISREEDKTAACLLATKMGLDPSEVTFMPLEHNVEQVSVTLVVGEDYKSLSWPGTSTKRRH